ncbi:MAG: Dynein light chain [Vezdaea aestivalis]|nr:MAG: Dynein light chain [Vezdaea aestivalis]
MAPAIIEDHKDTMPPKEDMKPQVKSADMSEDLQQEVMQVAVDALVEHKLEIEKEIAEYVKKEMDKRKGACWHCVVGRNFGSFVTHESKHFIYFYLGHLAFLLFKTQ